MSRRARRRFIDRAAASFGGVKMWTEDHSHMIDTNQNDNRQFRV